jgi:hypothetical protein
MNPTPYFPAPPSTFSQFSQALTSLLRQTLVVGGEPSFVARKLAVRLAKHGLFVAHHWPWKKQNGSFPESIEVLFVVTDMCGHPMSNAAVAEANKRGIPVIMGTRKHAVNIDKLNEAGFTEIPALSPQPHISPKREAAREAAKKGKTAPPVPSVVVDAVAATMPEPVSTSEPFPLPLPENTPMPTLPKNAPPSPADTSGLTEVQRTLLRALALSPGISNRALASQYNLSHGQVWEGVQWARAVLGIETSEGKQKHVKVTATKFNAACDLYGLDRVTIPKSGLYEKENMRNKPDARPAGRPRKVPTSSLVDAATAAHVVATVATSEVPSEVLANTPANVQRPLRVERIDGSARDLQTPKVVIVQGTADNGEKVTLHLTKPPLVGEPAPSSALKAAFVPSAVDPMQDLKDAVALLRAVMAAHGVETLTVTPTATSLRRVVVVEESLD